MWCDGDNQLAFDVIAWNLVLELCFFFFVSDSLQFFIGNAGNYSLESLLEMIALHLDGTCAEYDTWRELAMCFLKLSQIEEDRVSAACSIGSGGHKLRSSLNINCNLKLFTEKNLRNAWRLRCRWWLTHHFCCNITSETSDGTCKVFKLPFLCYFRFLCCCLV